LLLSSLWHSNIFTVVKVLLLEKPLITQLMKKIPIFYRTWKCNIYFTRNRHLVYLEPDKRCPNTRTLFLRFVLHILPYAPRYSEWCNMDPCIANILAEYNQQYATFYNLFISVRRSTCFRRVFRPSSGAQNCTHSVRYLWDQYLTLYVQFWALDDGRKTRLKHVERLTEINKLWSFASCWLYCVNSFEVIFSGQVVWINIRLAEQLFTANNLHNPYEISQTYWIISEMTHPVSWISLNGILVFRMFMYRDQRM